MREKKLVPGLIIAAVSVRSASVRCVLVVRGALIGARIEIGGAFGDRSALIDALVGSGMLVDVSVLAFRLH
jgi:hypothetical protein